LRITGIVSAPAAAVRFVRPPDAMSEIRPDPGQRRAPFRAPPGSTSSTENRPGARCDRGRRSHRHGRCSAPAEPVIGDRHVKGIGPLYGARGEFCARYGDWHRARKRLDGRDAGGLLRRLVVYAAPGVGPYRMPLGLRVVAVRFGLRPTARNAERFDRWAFYDFDRALQRNAEWLDAFSAYTRQRATVAHVKRTMRHLITTGTKRIPDTELESWYGLLLGGAIPDGVGPRDAKRALARALVARFWGDAAAAEAETGFDQVFIKHEIPEDVEEFVLSANGDLLHLPEVIVSAFGGSRSEARRMLAQGGVKLDGETMPAEPLDVPASTLDGRVLQLGKRKFRRLRIG